jgi:SAM-dependent methyltransferase
LKRCLRPFGIDENLLLRVFRSNSERALQRKLSAFNKKEIFEGEDLSKHFAHSELKEIASQNVVKGFIIDRIGFIERALGNDAIKNDTFIDVGDSDGIFIKALGKTGISANVSKVAVSKIHEKGFQVIRCDAEHLPLKSGAVDHILFFEIMEHLPNPILALTELNRVCKKSVILSIPCLSKTNIHRFNYNPSWFIYEHHIFEFNDKDFRKILSHGRFQVKNSEVAEVLGGGSFTERLVFWMVRLYRLFYNDAEYKNNQNDLFCGCFKKFRMYHLTKEKGE